MTKNDFNIEKQELKQLQATALAVCCKDHLLSQIIMESLHSLSGLS